MPRLRAFTRAEEGAIAVMSAISATCVVGCLALAVDVGSLHLERRHLQSMADVAAVAAVNNLDHARNAARAVLTANGIDAALEVETGVFSADHDIAPSLRYVSGGENPNAARVTLVAPGTLHFARVIYGGAAPQIRVRATAAEQNIAEFSIGSRLASVNEGVLNDILGDLLGTTLSLSLMDYEALIAADLDLLSLLQALGGEAGVVAGSYADVLDADLDLGDVLDASIAVAAASGLPVAQAALNKLELAPGGVNALPLDGGSLFDLGELGSLSLGERPSGFNAKVSALDLVRSAVQAAGPNNHASLALGTAVPGLASLQASVVLREPPQNTSWITLGPLGAEVHTAQARVRIAAELNPTLIAGSLLSLEVPLALDIASGRARLTRIECGSDPSTDAEVELAARPALGGLYIGDPADLQDWTSFAAPALSPAEVVNLAGLVRIEISAQAHAANAGDIAIAFDAGDIRSRAIKTVATSAPLASLLASAFGNLDVQASVAGLALPVVGTNAANAVRTAVAPIGTALAPVLQNLLDALGVNLGEADLRVYGVRCGAPALVM